jgi:hypothetical protein
MYPIPIKSELFTFYPSTVLPLFGYTHICIYAEAAGLVKNPKLRQISWDFGFFKGLVNKPVYMEKSFTFIYIL